LLGGLGYALLGSSRQLAIGPTSAISLMIAGTVGAMADGDVQRYAQIASLAGFTVGFLCLIAWLFRLSVLVRLISDSILVGFKAGAGLTIAMTQLPSLLGVAGGGHNFFERAWLLTTQLGQIHHLVLATGIIAIVLLLLGERLLSWPARCARRSGSIDRGCDGTWTSGSWGRNDRNNSGGPAQLAGSRIAPARR
jgi:SulP family sulfate permease